MTPLELLDALKAFIEENTKDILLPVRVDRKSGEAKERPAEVYKMRLPTKDAETKRIHKQRFCRFKGVVLVALRRLRVLLELRPRRPFLRRAEQLQRVRRLPRRAPAL